MSKSSSVIKERTSLRILLGSVALVLIGVILLVAAHHASPQWTAAPLNGLAGTMIAAGVLSFLWELAAKRAFLTEVMEVAGLGRDVEESGLVQLTSDFQRGLDWAKLIGAASDADMLLATGRTWRISNLAALKKFAERGRLRLALPDPQDQPLVDELARRFT
jgi:hypothetical protein